MCFYAGIILSRYLAKAFNIGITWDGTTNTVGINTSMEYTE